MFRRSLFFLGLIVIISSTLSFFMLTRGHIWPDDFAAYIMQARSILAWNMDDFIVQNSFTIQNSSYPPGPVAYPWGFPLLIVPVYAIFGLNALALKLVGVFFYAVFLVAFFFLARTRLDELDSLLLTGVFSVLPAFLAANDFIASDIPFLAFSTLSLLGLERFSLLTTGRKLALGMVIFLAFFVRTNGILLLPVLLIGVCQQVWPNWRLALKNARLPLATFVVLQVLQTLIFPGGQESYFSHFSMFSLQRLAENFFYYLWLPASVFDRIPGGVLLYPLLFLFVLVSLRVRARRDLALYAYVLLTLLVFIAWPERQGLRFIYPVLPIFFIIAFDGMRLLVLRVKTAQQGLVLGLLRSFWAFFCVVCLAISANMAYQVSSAGREINGPFDQYSNQMFSFLREKTPTNSVIIFMRPRALRLFTGRPSFMTEQCADLPNGDYLALHEKMGSNGQILPEDVSKCQGNIRLERVFNNKRFSVYRILR